MASGQPIRLEELLDHADWLRRLARQLAGEAGDDVAQDAWLAAQRSPPEDGRPPRPWLAQVVRNLIHVRRRDHGRRQRRELAYADTQPDRSAAVDEIYERLELERFIAEQVMALEESLRTVVALRYFEGLDSARIAALTGAPSGTVRWRLKQALDRLRIALDQRHEGNRRAWVALLAARPPKATTSMAGGLIMASAKTKTFIAAGLLLVALLFVGIGVLWRRSARTHLVPRGSAAATGARAAPPPLPRLVSVPGEAATTSRNVGALDDLPGCQTALRQATDEAEANEREARALVPRVAFAAGVLNPGLRDEVAPQIERLIGASAPGHEIECRAWACRLTVFVPNDGGADAQAWLRGISPWFPRLIQGLRGLVLGGPSPLGLAQQWGGGRAREDGRSRGEEIVLFVGAPPGERPDDASDDHSIAPPATSLSDCRRQVAEARAHRRGRDLELAGFRPPPDLFASSAPAPALARRLEPEVRAALGDQAVALDCRDKMCRLRLPDVPDAEDRLRTNPVLGGSMLNARRIDRDLYFLVRESPWKLMHTLRAPMYSQGYFAGCPAPPAEGTLLLRLTIPATGDLNDLGVPGRGSVRALGGTLAATPAAACLVERLTHLLDVELPSPIYGALRLETWTWRPGEEPALTTPE